MKIRNTTYLFIATFMMGSAHAALVLVDHPEGVATDTFYNSLTNVVAGQAPLTDGTSANRFSLDVNDEEGQTFTLASTITLDSIYLAYNDQQSTGTFDLLIDDANLSGLVNYTFEVAVTNALQSGGNNIGPYHFLQFDLSSENIELGAGTHSFSVRGTLDNGEGDWLIAPILLESTKATYSGGNFIGNTANDLVFAVTAIPEPSSALLTIFAGSALLLRRRRA